MNNTKWLRTAIAVLMIALMLGTAMAGCTPVTTPDSTEDPASGGSTTVPEGSEPEETLSGSMGLEDSIFDEPQESTGTAEKDETEPTEPTAGSTTESTEPADEPTTDPAGSATEPETTEPSTQPGGDVPSSNEVDYETYQAMSPAEQRAYVESFENLDLFFDWYNAAKEKYEEENPPIEIGGNGSIDIGNLPDGNG